MLARRSNCQDRDEERDGGEAWMIYRKRKKTYIVVVRLAHLETTAPRVLVRVLFIADYILEREASSPLALATSGVPLHAIAHGEIIPGANEAHGLDRWLRLTVRLGRQLKSGPTSSRRPIKNTTLEGGG